MGLTGNRTFVGFGFGAIQGGLFLYEAFQSGNFRRLVAGEVVAEVVRAVRAAGGHFAVNIAHADRVEVAEVGPIEIEDPAAEADRARLTATVAAADEIATAVPSVQFYVSSGPGSIHRILAEGLRSHGFEAFVASGPSEKVFRVLIGPLPNPESFRQAKAAVDAIDLTAFARRYEK